MSRHFCPLYSLSMKAKGIYFLENRGEFYYYININIFYLFYTNIYYLYYI